MWNLSSIEPGDFNFLLDRDVNPSYSLNPENFESNYYLYVYTNDVIYYNRAVNYLNDIITYCKCNANDNCVGYSGLKDVRLKSRANTCPSYFFGESLKYLYLTFMQNETITNNKFDFFNFIFNTECHPMPLEWGKVNIN